MPLPEPVKFLLRPGRDYLRKVLLGSPFDQVQSRSVGVDEFLSLRPKDPMRRRIEAFDWPEPPEEHPVDPEAPVRVVLHLHYPELWPEFAAALRRLPGSWGLSVTLTDNAAPAEADIRRRFPGASVAHVPNRGRDVGPFFQMIHDGELDGADVVLKLHGKRSPYKTLPNGTGDLWRQGAVISLIEAAEDVIGRFREDPRLGMVGTGAYLLPNHRVSEAQVWDVARPITEDFMLSRGLALPRLEFFAGSMFWIAAPALSELGRLGLTLEDFEDEGNYHHATLAHALERVFVPVVRDGGLRIGTI